MRLLILLLWACAAGAERPNIIYIMADDLGYGDLSCYGQMRFETPSLDRMASEGLRFTSHYSGSTVCAPSRCSLMTGLHTGHTSIRGNREHKPLGQEPMDGDRTTIAERLRDAGYATGAVGKWGLGYPGSEGDPNAKGFDFFFGYNCQRQAHRHYPSFLWRDGEKVEYPGNPESREHHAHDLMTAEAISFVQRHREDPFFLYLPYSVPHADVDAPEAEIEPFRGRFEERPHRRGGYRKTEEPYATFAAMVAMLDRDVGRLLDELETLGIAERTIVIFTSDNGPHREGGANPAYFNSSGGLRGVKRDLYEGGIRVPMIAWWPGTIEAGRETGHISAFWDVMPTACELAGIEAPADIDGLSFVPTLLGRPVQPAHEYLYWEFHEQGGRQAVRLGKWKGVRLGTKAEPEGPIELYDLSTDPQESTDLSSDHPAVVARITEIMRDARTVSPIWK